MPHSEGFTRVAANSNNTVLVAGGEDGTISFWAAPDTHIADSFMAPVVRMTDFSADGTTAIGANGFVNLARPDSSEPTGTLPDDWYPLGYLPGTRVAIAVDEATSRTGLWNVADSGHPQLVSTLPGDAIDERIAPSPSGHVVALTDPDQPVVDIWDITNPAIPRKRGSFVGLAPAVFRFVFPLTDTVAIMEEERDGDSLSTTSLWNIAQAPMTRISDLDITPTVGLSQPEARGTLLLGGSNDGTSIIDVADPRHPKLTGIPNQTGVLQAAGFIDDHTIALAFQQNNQIRLWEVGNATGPALLTTLTSQTDIRDFTTDSVHHELAAIGIDGSVRFWSIVDIRNPTILNTVEPPQETDKPTGAVVEFRHATNLAIIGRNYPDGPDSEVVDLDPERVSKDLCARYPQRLTSAQWNQYATGIPIQKACP